MILSRIFGKRWGFVVVIDLKTGFERFRRGEVSGEKYLKLHFDKQNLNLSHPKKSLQFI